MIAKGHDFPLVTLVGVLAADAALSMPDFRAAERTFQLLTQVAGRSGRGDRPGEVIIQSFFPDHYTFQLACTQRFEEFYARESRYRKAMFYPPFTALAGIVVTDRDKERAARRGPRRQRLSRQRSWRLRADSRSCPRSAGAREAPAPLSVADQGRIALDASSRAVGPARTPGWQEIGKHSRAGGCGPYVVALVIGSGRGLPAAG